MCDVVAIKWEMSALQHPVEKQGNAGMLWAYSAAIEMNSLRASGIFPFAGPV